MTQRKARKPAKKPAGKDGFVSPLSDRIVRAVFGSQKNIRNTEAFLKPIIGIPPEDYAGMRVVSPAFFRRWRGDKEGILDIRLATKSGRTIHIEIQINPFRAMIPRILYYQARMVADQLHSGEEFDRIQQVISVVIFDYNLLPGKKYLSVFEFCDIESSGDREKGAPEPFTDIQKIVIIELRKLPVEDDGTALWPHLKFLACKTEEEMAMLASKYPEVKGAVKEYRRLTLREEIRWFIDDLNDARRVRRAREAYVREEGYNQAAAEYREQLATRDEQLAVKDGQLAAKDGQIQQLEDEVRRLRGE
jgi:predicted transposase/invertase (TIGR01784 family)